MQIKKIKIKDLNSPEWNPRTMPQTEMTKLENSIQEFGFVEPIIVNEYNMNVVGGNQRLQAFKNLGYEEIDAIMVNIPDLQKEQALNITLNNVSGEWNPELLEEILTEMELTGFDIGLTSLDDLQLEELEIKLPNDTADVPIIEDDFEVDEDIETDIKLGDKFQLGNHFLLCGDATQEEDINQLLTATGDEIKVDMVLTDVPYGMGLDTDYSKMNNPNGKITEFNQREIPPKSNNYTEKKVDLFNENILKNIFKLNVNEVFLWGADYFTENIPNLKEGSWIVWDKRTNEKPFPEDFPLDKMFGSCFELCWSKTKHKREIARIRWAGLYGVETEFDKQRVHPTQKPIRLSAWFINKYSSENDVILDLTAGSGSTLLASEQTHRRYYAMEIEPVYCQIIINRFENLTGENAIKIN